MFELVDNAPQNAVIKVIGVGGGGGNAVRHMIEHDIEGVDFICANTDSQALADIDSRTVLQLGNAITKGLGAGANPEIGRAAALEDRDRIAEALQACSASAIRSRSSSAAARPISGLAPAPKPLVMALPSCNTVLESMSASACRRLPTLTREPCYSWVTP